jgi:hypothetical protein
VGDATEYRAQRRKLPQEEVTGTVWRHVLKPGRSLGHNHAEASVAGQY